MQFDVEDFIWSNGKAMEPPQAAAHTNRLLKEWFLVTEESYKKALDALRIIHETGTHSDSDLAARTLKDLGEL